MYLLRNLQEILRHYTQYTYTIENIRVINVKTFQSVQSLKIYNTNLDLLHYYLL